MSSGNEIFIDFFTGEPTIIGAIVLLAASIIGLVLSKKKNQKAVKIVFLIIVIIAAIYLAMIAYLSFMFGSNAHPPA
jgi:uncharacterized membrane protein